MEPRTLGGRYELTRQIGSGGMGTVWRARDRSLGREVAVKLLHEGLASDTAFAERFRREARSAAGLAHDNIVAVYDSGEDQGVPFIVMELVEGPTLHARLHGEGPLSVRQTVAIGRAVLPALAHAHQAGLVHRDVKPGNVLLAPDGVKVADFGIAKAAGEGSDLTRTGSLLGTAAYLSPEQAAGHPATPLSDVYAVGCLLYACLTGAPPFEADSPVAIAVRHAHDPVPSIRARRPDVPPAVEQAVVRALEKDPARRFASAAEMDAALAAIDGATLPDAAPTLLAPAPEPTAPMARTEALPARPRRSPAGTVLGVLAVMLLAAALTWLLAVSLSDRGPGILQGPLPTEPSPATPAPTVPEPTPTPLPEDQPTPTNPTLDLPGINIVIPDEPPPTEEPADEPTPSPTDEPEDG